MSDRNKNTQNQTLQMSLNRLQVVVIGGGAAGFFGAIACTQANPKAKVILLEAGRQPLSKVRISGGGRCNVTHACFEPGVLAQNYPRGGKALRGAFTRFQPKDMVAWLNQQGVELKTEADGRMFPITDNSATVVNCLLTAAKDAGVELRTESPVMAVYPLETETGSGFEIELKSGEMLECNQLLLATGSSPRGYQIAKSLGHTIEPPVPSLFTFKIRDARLEDLAGVAVKTARVRLPEAKLEQTGPVLVTHWGLSGPAVLKLSAWGARFLHDRRYDTPLVINWLPEYKLEVLQEQMQAVRSQLPRKAIATSCPFPVPRRLWERLLAATEIDHEKRWSELSNKAINQLITELTQSRYQIVGKGEFKEEFVTCGGIALKEVEFKTMESRRCPGLFFAGEILDIDGITGGFNFQSAWTTSWLAGQGMARYRVS
jgi:hypothetical protein